MGKIGKIALISRRCSTRRSAMKCRKNDKNTPKMDTKMDTDLDGCQLDEEKLVKAAARSPRVLRNTSTYC